jgi:alanyl-tRNA synthetase
LKLISGIERTEEADVDLLIKVASKLVQLDDHSVAVLISVDKNARMIVMVGEKAQKLGIDAREITKEAAAELGGGGSGKPDFAQGGGTKVENVTKALQKAKAVVQKKVKR